MTTHSEHSALSDSWPAERFYWAVIDAPIGRHGLRAFSADRAVPLPPGLIATMQDNVPVPMEDLHAVGIPIERVDSGAGASPKILALAVDRASLADIHSSGVRSLCPASVPLILPELDRVDAAKLNILVGDFEPRAIRRRRIVRHLLGAAAVLALTTFVSVGLHRRAESSNRIGEAAVLHTRTLLTTAAGDAPSHDRMGLQRELARTKALRAVMHDPQANTNAIPALLSTLKMWPASTSATPQTLSIASSGGGEYTATLSVSVEGDPADFLRRLTPPEGWTLEEPRLNASRDVTRVVLTLRPAKPTHHAAVFPRTEATP